MITRKERELVPVMANYTPANNPDAGTIEYFKDDGGAGFIDDTGVKHYYTGVNENTITSATLHTGTYNGPLYLDLKDGYGFGRVEGIAYFVGELVIKFLYTSNTEVKKIFVNGVEKTSQATISNTQLYWADGSSNNYIHGLNEVEIFIGYKSFKYFIYFEGNTNPNGYDILSGQLTLQERFQKYNRKSIVVKDINYTLGVFDNILYYNMTANRVLTIDDYLKYNFSGDTTAPTYKIITTGNFTLTINATGTDRLVYNGNETATLTLSGTLKQAINLTILNTGKIIVENLGNLPLDTTAPVLQVPITTASVYGDKFYTMLGGTTEVAGSCYVRVKKTGNAGNLIEEATIQPGNPMGFELSVPLNSHGVNTFFVQAFDLAGNVSNSITVNVTSYGAFETKQTKTDNTAINFATESYRNIYLNINPATAQNFNSTITLPTTPFDKQYIKMVFGGTIALGLPVATTLGLPGTVFFPVSYTYDTTWNSGESLQLVYDSVIAKWRLINK